MKTATLLIALGFASSSALAQVQTQSPTQPQGAGAQPGSPSQMPSSGGGMPGGSSGSMNGASPSPSSPGASGAEPGPQSGAAPSTGTSGTSSDLHSGMSGPSTSGTRAESPSAPSRSSTSGASTRGTSSSGADARSDTRQQTSSMEASGGAPSPVARLQPKTENGVTYLCGGVGQEEVNYMKQEARNHDVMLQFATTKGEYLADVNVEIADARGTPILQTTCDGPILVADLPKPGNYRIRAEAGGYTLNRTVNVPANRHGGMAAAAVLSWPERVAQAPSTAETQSGGGGSRSRGASGNGSR